MAQISDRRFCRPIFGRIGPTSARPPSTHVVRLCSDQDQRAHEPGKAASGQQTAAGRRDVEAGQTSTSSDAAFANPSKAACARLRQHSEDLLNLQIPCALPAGSSKPSLSICRSASYSSFVVAGACKLLHYSVHQEPHACHPHLRYSGRRSQLAEAANCSESFDVLRINCCLSLLLLRMRF